MINGLVNARLEATVQLQIEDSAGQLHTIDTIIDTGFSSDLTLRSAEVAALGLSWSSQIDALLANGTIVTLDVYNAILWWDGYPILVRVRAVETDPLLGTGLLAGFELKVPFVAGGVLTIERIP